MPDLHQIIENGSLDELRSALANGADVGHPGHCGATPLIAAIRQKNEAMFELLLEHGADPDLTDDFNHTALHAAAQYDWPYAVGKLIELGVDLGRNPKYPLKEVDYDISGIMEQMGPPSMPEEMAGLMDEEEWQSLASGSEDMMAVMGKNPEPEPVIKDACSVAVLQLLIDAGEPLEDADAELRREYIGLPAEAPLECSKASYLEDRYPRFGSTNPERVESEYLEAMVTCGGNAYVARQKFNDEDLGQAVWCYDRHGHSLTKLPDGRFISIAGEHEDYYDPDFFIYNDVFVHDGAGGVEIYRYPKGVFPPTDFHTATLVGDQIIIIGSLGYPDDRQVGHTPVFCLDLATMAIQAVETSGENPGWISRHHAVVNMKQNCIQLYRGVVWQETDAGCDLCPSEEFYRLDLATKTWTRLPF